MNRITLLKELLNQRVLVLDGAMGTMIQRHSLKESDFRNKELQNHPKNLQGNNDLLSITRPDIIYGIHKLYLEAGADIIETNTFSGTTVAQGDYELENWVDAINYESALLAKKACEEFTTLTPDKPRFVAGSIGPTNRTCSLSPDVNDPGFRAITFDELAKAYKQQALALLKGGIDIFLIETVFDTLNAKAAIYALLEIFDENAEQERPIMISGTITDASGRTLSGQTTEAFLISVMHAPLLSIGLNCALGASAMRPYLQVLSAKAPFYISVYPNAGLPNEMGQYDENPEFMGKQVEVFLKEKLVNILGGCCGTTPEHIKVMAELAAKYSPRKLELNSKSE